MFTPAQAVTLAFLLGVLTVLFLLYAAYAIQARARRPRVRTPPPVTRPREDALPTRTEYAGDDVWGSRNSRRSN
jgi:hypothetical protein